MVKASGAIRNLPPIVARLSGNKTHLVWAAADLVDPLCRRRQARTARKSRRLMMARRVRMWRARGRSRRPYSVHDRCRVPVPSCRPPTHSTNYPLSFELASLPDRNELSADTVAFDPTHLAEQWEFSNSTWMSFCLTTRFVLVAVMYVR